jgi:hypothetical protein
MGNAREITGVDFAAGLGYPTNVLHSNREKVVAEKRGFFLTVEKR